MTWDRRKEKDYPNDESQAQVEEWIRLNMLDVAGVAELAEVKPRTISAMACEKQMPEPMMLVNGTKVWWRATIVGWLESRNPSARRPRAAA